MQNKKHKIKVILKTFFHIFGFEVTRRSKYMVLHANSLLYEKNERWISSTEVPVSFKDNVLGLMKMSNSQLEQDLLVVTLTNGARGYFVEFGATDGISGSNTYLLEKSYGWEGICAEPARIYHQLLRKNRNCDLDFRCISNISNKFEPFSESGYLSTISRFELTDQKFPNRPISDRYLVETVTLNELLKEHNAPQKIDFISIDTEGSELEILQAFSFDDYDVLIFCIEHNYSQNEAKIDNLLSIHGYQRIFRELSKFDGWYVNGDLYSEIHQTKSH
jgi:FkbM family methyltransferase